ncbi:mitochondrial thiamine pyrophosphate carrier-like [Venturia canescens]|uniref:mitochondrial thiamine pyrophosphate carrier-like n=1 Tax=Venturia canescens TaxID=32260 RepID=UPI001C9CD7E5|nr:mitochondrial thiamine pyrophosphate carrier-like [Venturia canescens]
MGSHSARDKDSDHAIAGGTSGFVTRLICQPLDVIKIRFQLQVEPIRHNDNSKYRSLAHAVNVIVKEEGLLALWKGHVPAQILSIVYGLGQFYSYNIFKKFFDQIADVPEWKKSVNFIAGAAAGSVATIISYPFDTVRTRLVSQSSNNPVYRGVLNPYLTILRTESTRSFFRGLSPTLLQISPHAGLQFMFYGWFVDTWQIYYPNDQTNITSSMIAGSSAGLAAKTLVYPFDLARKRLQIQGFEHGRKGFGQFFTCHGLIDCAVQTFRNEGFCGLFKGLVPSQIKAAATTALHFTVYEQTLLLLQKMREFSTSTTPRFLFLFGIIHN